MADSTPFVSRRTRRGMTLVEILVAAAIAMIVLLAVIQIFQTAGLAVQEGRAAIELAGQVRRAGEQVRGQIIGATVATKPDTTDAAAEGYFEIIEGPGWDGATTSVVGDADDILMFTARSEGEPFVGRFTQRRPDTSGMLPYLEDPPRTIESDTAEIVWWSIFNPAANEATVYCRVFLVRPDLSMFGWPASDGFEASDFYAENDISVRSNGSGLVANTLADLTKRENRFAHVSGFPHPVNGTFLNNGFARPLPANQKPVARDEDIALRHALAFDVKVYDPRAQVRMIDPALATGDPAAGIALIPSDIGYNLADPPPPVGMGQGALLGLGAYVDVGYGAYRPGYASASLFSQPGQGWLNRPFLWTVLGNRTYCTWSSHYERDGIDQDGDGPIDEGTDGLDNDGVNGVDNGDYFDSMGNLVLGEQETSPPYPYPLRGIQITIRAIDLDSQKVRQVTVQQDFLRE